MEAESISLLSVTRKPRKPRETAGTTPGYRAFRDAFEALYRERSGGKSYDWAGKANKLATGLLSRHGVDEVITRAQVMFQTWRSGVPDLGCLCSRWDTFVTDARPPNGQVRDVRTGAFAPTGKEKYDGAL